MRPVYHLGNSRAWSSLRQAASSKSIENSIKGGHAKTISNLLATEQPCWANHVNRIGVGVQPRIERHGAVVVSPGVSRQEPTYARDLILTAGSSPTRLYQRRV